MSKLNDLSLRDTYSLILFALYKITEVPEYSSLSELIYVLDEKSLLKLCEYYGGQTITIPTIQQLQNLISALTLYYKKDVLHETIPDKEYHSQENSAEILRMYRSLKQIMEEYEFVPRES